MNKHSIFFIGLDTHKNFTEVAYIEDVRGAKPQHLGRILSNKSAFKKLVRQLQSKYPQTTLHFIYEAGPCGYWIYRLFVPFKYLVRVTYFDDYNSLYTAIGSIIISLSSFPVKERSTSVNAETKLFNATLIPSDDSL